jgi:hypothetical protein
VNVHLRLSVLLRLLYARRVIEHQMYLRRVPVLRRQLDEMRGRFA